MTSLRTPILAFALVCLSAPACSDASDGDPAAPLASEPTSSPAQPPQANASPESALPAAGQGTPQPANATDADPAKHSARHKNEASSRRGSDRPEGVSINLLTGEQTLIPAIGEQDVVLAPPSLAGLLAQPPGGVAGAVEEPRPQQVVGADQRYYRARTERYPKSMTAKIISKWKGPKATVVRECSGTVIGDRSVLTAAHCVYAWDPHSDSGNASPKPDEIRVIPGMEEDFMPFGDSHSIDELMPAAWKQGVDNDFDEEGDPEDDYALLTLDRRIGRLTGTMPLVALSDDDLKSKGFGMDGYPGDLPVQQAARVGRLMYRTDATITDKNSQILYHDGDTKPGQSGAGIQFVLNGTYFLGGVHKGEYLSVNRGRRITPDLINTLVTWMNSRLNMLPVYDLGGNSAWASLGGITLFPPTGNKAANGIFDMFVHGTDDAVWTNQDNMGTRTGWISLGGNASQGISAVTIGDEEFVFSHSEGTGGIMVKKKMFTQSWTQGGWTQLTPIGGPAFRIHTPRVIEVNGTLQVFGIGTDGHIFTTNCTTTFTCQQPWQDLGGDTVDASVVRVQDSSRRFVVVFRDHNGVFFARENVNNVWQSWVQIPNGTLISRATLLSPTSGLVNLFARGLDNTAYQQWETTPGSWNFYNPQGGLATSAVASVSQGQGDLLIMSRNPQGRLQWSKWSGSNWSLWNVTDLSSDGPNGGFIEEPSMAWVTPSRMATVARGRDSQLYFRVFNGTSWL